MDNIGASSHSVGSRLDLSTTGTPASRGETPSVRSGAGVPVEGGSIATRNIAPASPDPASVNWVSGGLYACFKDDVYTCFKVLAVDERGVHVKVFPAEFKQLPSASECRRLAALPSNAHSMCPEHKPLIGHAPVLRSSLDQMDIRLIAASSVGDDELEGYRVWEEAQGGYFKLERFSQLFNWVMAPR